MEDIATVVNQKNGEDIVDGNLDSRSLKKLIFTVQTLIEL